MLHYINYKECIDIDYRFLLALYGIAKRNNVDRINNQIKYTSISELRQRFISKDNYIISTSKITTHLSNKNYCNYFLFDKSNKTITLLNNFKKDKAISNKFITITEKERIFLMKQNDNLLCKYFFYIKYYCGISKSKTTDFTAKQFLAAVGYSCNSGNLFTQICNYNALLLENGFIFIKKFRDIRGKERNIYSISG